MRVGVPKESGPNENRVALTPPGFAGIDNPLFYLDITLMFFANAKDALERSLSAMEDL